jgi:hypothetical protein
MEKDDIGHNQGSMRRTRSDAGAATLRVNIYVVGGFDEVAPTNTAEVFCPGTGTGRWSMISPIRVARSCVNSILHVVGGWDGQQRLMSGEMYNPDTKDCARQDGAQVQPQPGLGLGEASGDWWQPGD